MSDSTFEAPGPGTWTVDDAHVLRPKTRYLAEIEIDAQVVGRNDGLAEYGFPVEVDVALVNRFKYITRRPIDGAETTASETEATEESTTEFQRRVDRMAETFETRRWRTDLERWDAEWKPDVRDRNDALQAVEPTDLDDERLIDHLEDCRDTLRDAYVLHHRMAVCDGTPVGDYLAHVRHWAPDYRDAAVKVLAGTSPDSAGAVDELDRLAEALHADRAARQVLFSDAPPGTILDRLQSIEGLVGAAIDDWLAVVGYRLVSGWDLDEPYGLERPGSLVNTLRTAVEDGPDQGNDHDHSELRETIRRVMPPDQRAEFDERYGEARRVNRVKDERSLLDIRTRGLLRRALSAAGRRLAERGWLHEPDHVVDVKHGELVSALRGGTGPSADDVAAHVEYRNTRHVRDVPARLESEPSDPLPVEEVPEPAARGMRGLRALGWADSHSDRLLESDEDVIRGTAASDGTFEGPARVVSGPEDFSEIQQDDVLVADATSSAFNAVLPLLGAIVTDRGGMLSHPAIVAREFGIPCVVGCEDATERIQEGDRIVVDGGDGTVRVTS